MLLGKADVLYVKNLFSVGLLLTKGCCWGLKYIAGKNVDLFARSPVKHS